MYKCLFCGKENTSEKAQFCTECGPDGPAKDWLPDDIDQPEKRSKYVFMLSEFFFDAKDIHEVEKYSLRLRQKLKITFDTHSRALTTLAKQKKSVEHLANFRFEFDENVVDAYAGHDTFLKFRYTNLSEDELFKVTLTWDDPNTSDRIDLKAGTISFVKPLSSVTIGASAIFHRIGVKELSDLQIIINDQFGASASFRAEPISFKVGNHDQRVTNNISTHNQISIEGRGVVDASGMGADNATTSTATINQPNWRELEFSYIPTTVPDTEAESKVNEEVKGAQLVAQKSNDDESPQRNAIEFSKGDLPSLLRAAERGSAAAQIELGLMYIWGDGVTQDGNKAFQWFLLAAEQGVAEAQTYLGDCYLNGDGVSMDHEKALHWYSLAAEQGNAEAQNNIGNIFEDGLGVSIDYSKATYWFSLAAEQGHVLAQYNLGKMYLEGQGIGKDIDIAIHWYRLAAKQGDAMAQVTLGDMHAIGIDIAQDYEKAIYWYQMAADQGDADGQFNLGSMFRESKGVAQDYEKVVHLYSLAAEQGHALAQFCLAGMYETGEGVFQNNEKALHWCRLAADQGLVDAQYWLGYMYRSGLCVAQDNQKAIYWFRLAAVQKHSGARRMLIDMGHNV